MGGYAPNGFGLHDMVGNVWEWTADCWNGSYEGAPVDGRAWQSWPCASRVVRGGGWKLDLGDATWLRVSYRYAFAAATRGDVLGFRLAQEP